MNSKSTNRPTGDRTTGRGVSRPEGRSGAKPSAKGRAFRSSEKTMPDTKYSSGRVSAPVAKPTSPQGGTAVPSALAEALRVATNDIKALRNDAAQKDTEIKALQKRLTQMEARQKAQEKAYRMPKTPVEPHGQSAE